MTQDPRSPDDRQALAPLNATAALEVLVELHARMTGGSFVDFLGGMLLGGDRLAQAIRVLRPATVDDDGALWRAPDGRETKTHRMVADPVGTLEEMEHGKVDVHENVYGALVVQPFGAPVERGARRLSVAEVREHVYKIQNAERGIHEHFELSYAQYLVLNRTLLQSMPMPWQRRFVRCLDELEEAFSHVEHTSYRVEAGTWKYPDDLSDEQLRALGWSVAYVGEDGEEDDEDGRRVYYTPEGEEHSGVPADVFVPGEDPVPPYDRGRARVERRPKPDAAPEGAA